MKYYNDFYDICRGAGAGAASRPQQQAPMAGAWKPDVKPVGAMPTQPAAPGQTFTQTSLKINKPVWFLYPIEICLFTWQCHEMFRGWFTIDLFHIWILCLFLF